MTTTPPNGFYDQGGTWIPQGTASDDAGPYGVTLDIHREHNGTNGISSRYDKVTVVGVLDDRARSLSDHTPAADRVTPLPTYLRDTPASDHAPAVWLRIQTVRNMGTVYSVEPATAVGEYRPWFMYGGNQATSSDPRWLAFATTATVNVRDRVES